MIKKISILLIGLSISLLTTQAQTWTQVGVDIDGIAEGDRCGYDVSLSADGSTLAVGSPRNDDNGPLAGHVRIFENIAGTWTQIGATLVGDATQDMFGFSVSLSDDGSILAASSPFYDGISQNSGLVKVFQNIAGTWTQIGADITVTDPGDDRLGYAIDLNSDGSTIVTSAILNDGSAVNAGTVRVFENISGTWTQVGADINGEAEHDQFGYDVSISSDGSIIAAGSYYNDGNGNEAGHARVFQNIGGTWTQIGEDIDGDAAGDQSGWSVSLSDNGSIVAVGSPKNDDNGNNTGHVKILKNVAGTWTQIGAKINGVAADDQYGWSVSLNADGTKVAASALGNDDNGLMSGHVRIFENIANTWTQIGTDIDGEAVSDNFGWSVNLSADGSTVVGGAYKNDGNGNEAGHARVYTVLYNVTFNVTDGTIPIENANVTFNGTTQQTNASGITVFAGLSNSTTAYSITKTGYDDTNSNVTVSGSNVIENVTMTETDYVTATNIVMTNITASSATVTWDGQGAEQYLIYHCKVGTSSWAVSSSLSSPFTIQNLEPNTQYYCKMRTNIAGVAGNYSALASFTTSEGVSTTASNIVITGTTPNSATVTWDGEGADRYIVYYNKVGTSSWGYYIANSSPYTIQNLEPNTDYNCRMKTDNSGVLTCYTPISNFTTSNGSSSVASNIVITGITASSATVNWDGEGADRYIIYYNKVGTSNWAVSIATSSPFTLQNLDPNAQYYCRMKTDNGGVATNYTPVSSFTTSATKNFNDNRNIDLYSISENIELVSYPNPFNTNTTVMVNGEDGLNFDMKVIDVTGKVINEQVIVSNEHHIIGQEFEKGIYIIVVTNSNGFSQKIKLIKMR